MKYVYIQTEPQLWTVGFYTPDGKWHPESDWPSPEEAANRVHYLNGGIDCKKDLPSPDYELIKQLEEEGPEALIQLVKEQLEAWAVVGKIVWNATGNDAVKSQMENYSTLAHALEKCLTLLRQKN